MTLAAGARLGPYEILAPIGYDVTRDGNRFLRNSGLPQNSSPITLVTNWTAELEKKP